MRSGSFWAFCAAQNVEDASDGAPDDLVPRDPWTGDDVRERWRDADREDEPDEPEELDEDA